MSTYIRVAGLFASAIVTSGATAQTAVEWKVSEGGNGHWYQGARSDEFLTWSEAKQLALFAAGGLLSLGTQAESDWVFAHVVSDGHLWMNYGPYIVGPWLGVRGVNGLWRWDDGTPLGYSAWFPGEGTSPGPQEQFAHYYGGIGSTPAPENRWADYFDAAVTQSFVIEWSADCNADGIVDFGQNRQGTFADFNGNNIPDCCERGEPCVLGNYPVEWKVGDGGNGHWYQVINLSGQGKIYWNASRSRAIEAGGDLACFESAAETNAFLKLTSGQTRGNPWMGLYQDRKASDYTEPAGGWRWTSGASLAWTNWASGEPNDAEGEDWANMWIDFGPVGTWNDYKPTDPQGPDGFIIEWTADCNSDGIVDYGQILRGDLVDRDENGVPDSCQCASNGSLDICCTSDLDLDGEVSTSDISLLLLSFGEQRWLAPAYDRDRDGAIGSGDLSVIMLDFGPCYQTPLAAPAPEIPPLLDAQALPDATRHR